MVKYITLFTILSFQIAFGQNYYWQLKQSGSGRGNPIAVDPNNSNVVYYGSTNVIYKSTDKGESFSPFGSSISGSSNIKNIILHPDKPDEIFAATYSSNYRTVKSTNNGQTWVVTADNLTFAFYGIPTTQDPSVPDNLYMMNGNNFMRSTDFGSTWTTLTSNVGTTGAPCDIEVFPAPNNNIILVGDNGHGIFRSTDSGSTWSQVYVTSGEIPTMAIDKNIPGVAWGTKFGGGQQVIRTTDYGATWNIVASFGTNTWGVSIHPTDPNYVAVGTWSGSYVYITKDFGVTWLQTQLPSSNYAVTVVDSMTVYAAQSGGFFKLDSPFFIPVELTSFTVNTSGSIINLEWNTATETNNSGFEIEKYNAGNDEWIKLSFIPGYGTTTEKRHYSYSYGEKSYGKFSYRLKQIDYDGTVAYSHIVEADVLAPAEFSLSQNYPNPFNPSTTINFSVPVESKVTIKLFNLMGEEVSTIYSGVASAGSHPVIFNSKKLSSGTYFYKIEAAGNNGETFTSSKKLTLLK